MKLLYVEDEDGASLVSVEGKIVYADEPEAGFDNAHFAAFEVAENLADVLLPTPEYWKVFLSKADAKGKKLMFTDMLKVAQSKLEIFKGDAMCDGCIAGKAEFLVPGMIRLCFKCFEKDLT